MKKIFLLFASISLLLMTGCLFTRPAQVLVWRSNSALMATEGKTATITKGAEGNSVNADRTSSNESKAIVSGTGTVSDASTDNSVSSQQTKPEPVQNEQK